MEVLTTNPPSVVGTTCTAFPIRRLPWPFLTSRIEWTADRPVSAGKLTMSKPKSTTGKLQRCMSMTNLESLFCYDKSVPEEIIDTPVGLSLKKKDTGNNPPCTHCQSKGAVLCATCSGCGLYVDSILESQGVIVKVRCLGCGGTGNIMCSECGGRGHV